MQTQIKHWFLWVATLALGCIQLGFTLLFVVSLAGVVIGTVALPLMGMWIGLPVLWVCWWCVKLMLGPTFKWLESAEHYLENQAPDFFKNLAKERAR